MATLQPYNKYNAIAYDYAKQLPEGWQLLPNIAIFQERIERGHINEELLSVTIGKGVIKQTDVDIKKDSSNEDKSKYKLIKVGDIAYNKMRMWQGALGYSDYQGISSPAYVILKPKMKINPRYFHYMYRTSFYTNYSKRFSYGIVDDQLSLRYVDFKRMYSIVPPLSVQNSIVAYLDKKNQEIDKFIRNKERLIELLEEQKQSEIDKCISVGIDGNVKLVFGRKEIPNYPSHWQLKRMKHLFSILNGFAFSTDLFISEGIQVLKISSLYQNQLSLDRQPTFVHPKYLKSLKQFVVTKGDILISLTGTLGKKDYGYAIQLQANHLYLLNQRVAKLIPKTIIDSNYALYLLRSDVFLNQLYMCPSGTKQANLSNDDILSQHIAIPNKEEQKQIAEHLNEALKTFDLAISKAQKEIGAIKEYREALITDLVTGKRSVPQLQIS
jgi:type I restriction enzyme S subunit